MSIIYLLYGLAFFTLGLAALLESRRNSALLLGRQLPWLAAFGLSHSLVEWGELVVLTMPATVAGRVMDQAHIILLPLSALFLIRFGVGLISESGPLPRWFLLWPLVIFIPAGLVITYALVVALTEPDVRTATDIWSRYLLYIPGAILAAAGFLRQASNQPKVPYATNDSGDARANSFDSGNSWQKPTVRRMMRAAGGAFIAYAFFAGLIVPPARFGLAPWLNYDLVVELTGLPVQVWRMVAAFGVTIFVVRALDVFEHERKQELKSQSSRRAQAEDALRHERERAHEAQLRMESEARQVAETWVNTLVEISRRIVQMDNVDGVLTHIVSQGQRLLSADTVSLGLFDESGQNLDLKYQASNAEKGALRTPFHIDNDDLIRILHSGRSQCFPGDRRLSDITWYCPTVAREIKAAAVVPLQFDGQVVGGIWAARFTVNPFTSDQLFGLENLADQAVIALQHASMASQLQSIATLEERSRIAREMHDGLAQILGYLGLQMQTIEAYLKTGKEADVLAEIRKTRQNIKLAQADVRENILSLRTTLAGEAGLIPALQEYVAEFGVQSATCARFHSDLKRAPNLSPLAEVQLVRIVQEALTNVRKHAHATRVDVNLSRDNGGLALIIDDDGRGLDKDAVSGTNGSAHNFGLQTMVERAESVGGALKIHSEPQRGTTVRLWMPLVRE